MRTSASYRKLSKLYNTFNDTHNFLVKASEEIERIERIQKIYKKQRVRGRKGKKQSGGTSDDVNTAAGVIGFNLFQQDPVDLYDLLNTLILKYSSEPSAQCTKEVQELQKTDYDKIVELKQNIKTLRKTLIIDLKRTCSNCFSFLHPKNTITPNANNSAAPQTTFFDTLNKYKEKTRIIKSEISNLKLKNYEEIFKSTLFCKEADVGKDIKQNLQLILGLFNKHGSKTADIYYLHETVNNNTWSFYTYYVYITNNDEIDNIIKPVIQCTTIDKTIIINRFFLLTGKETEPIVSICYDKEIIVLQKDSNHNNVDVSMKPTIFSNFFQLKLDKIQKHLYLLEYDDFNRMNKTYVQNILGTPLTVPDSYVFNANNDLLVIEQFTDKMDNNAFIYLVHFKVNDTNVYLVAIKYVLSDVTEDQFKTTITNNMSKIRNDVLNYLQNKGQVEEGNDEPFFSGTFSIYHVPSPERYKYYPKFNDYVINTILTEENKTSLNGLWMILDDI